MSKTQRAPVRIAWITTKEQASNYTYKVLCWWIRQCGGEIVDRDNDPDVLFASFCSPRETALLNKARSCADDLNVPLVLGGPESYTGAMALAWCDYLCVGEGWGLLKEICQAGKAGWRDVLDNRYNVLRCDDPYRQVEPDYNVIWNLPVVQTARHGWYALQGRGCYRKCKFCYTSWVQPHQECPQGIVERAQKKVKAKRGQNKLIYITNDAGIGESAASTTAERFLANPKAKWPMVTRIGVEGLTEEKRKWFGKPITNADLAACAQQAKSIGRQMQWFVLIGWPDDPTPEKAWQDFLSEFGCDPSRAPRIYIKYTWFEPAPHTPLGKYDLSEYCAYDHDTAHHNLVAASGRFRKFKPGSVGAAIWSACIRRLGPEKAKQWAGYANKCKQWDLQTAQSIVKRELGKDVLTGDCPMPWESVQAKIK